MAQSPSRAAPGPNPTLPRPFQVWDGHLTVSLPSAQVLFSTRRGGFSAGPFESLNLGRATQDLPENVRRNRRRLRGQVGRDLAMARQVHGTTVHCVDVSWPGRDEESGLPPEGDGIATAAGALAPAVLTADCLPVALASPGAVAMLHAGWRGLAAGIIREGVRALRALDSSGRIQAVIGPGIGPCCYEVGEEVHGAFAGYGAKARRGQNLDLKAVARAQLEAAGVEEVLDVGLCTSCRPELFFSHRRDHGVTGRQAGVVWSS